MSLSLRAFQIFQRNWKGNQPRYKVFFRRYFGYIFSLLLFGITNFFPPKLVVSHTDFVIGKTHGFDSINMTFNVANQNYDSIITYRFKISNVSTKSISSDDLKDEPIEITFVFDKPKNIKNLITYSMLTESKSKIIVNNKTDQITYIPSILEKNSSQEFDIYLVNRPIEVEYGGKMKRGRIIVVEEEAESNSIVSELVYILKKIIGNRVLLLFILVMVFVNTLNIAYVSLVDVIVDQNTQSLIKVIITLLFSILPTILIILIISLITNWNYFCS